jgi:membrane protein implicated in regulation of membrane protease activity
MELPTFWWLLAGIAVVVELLMGTFYLLMIATGFAAAALAAHTGAGQTAQIVTAALVGGGAVVAWHFKRMNDRSRQPENADTNIHLDIGESIQINHWKADGTSSVQYRGANWTAMHRAGVQATAGLHRVAEVVGSRLLVDKI